MASQTVTSFLKLFKHCKNSVRFNSINGTDPVLRSVYLGNEAFEELGKPEKITVTLRAKTTVS